MGARVDDTSSDEMDFGSGANIDDWSVFTWATWFFLDSSPPTYSTIGGKGDNGEKLFYNGPVGTEFGGDVLQSGSPCSIESTSGTMVANDWNFLVYAYDNGATPRGKLYWGDLTTTVAEVGSYGRQLDGSGTTTAEATDNFVCGSRAFGGGGGLGGIFSSVWYINEVLSVAEMAALQWLQAPHPTNQGVYCPHMDASAGQDLSGNGYDGTGTSLTDDDDVPIATAWTHYDHRSGFWLPAALSGIPLLHSFARARASNY